MKMTQLEYLALLAKVYSVANRADSDNPLKVDWLKPNAASHQCFPIDQMVQALRKDGSITAEEEAAFYDMID